jgi:hypothetical protein
MYFHEKRNRREVAAEAGIYKKVSCYRDGPVIEVPRKIALEMLQEIQNRK